MQHIETENNLHTDNKSETTEYMVPRCNNASKSESSAQIMKCECTEKQGTLQITVENKYYCIAPTIYTPSN